MDSIARLSQKSNIYVFVCSSFTKAETNKVKVSLWLTGGVLYFRGRQVMFSQSSSVSTCTTETKNLQGLF